MRVITGGNASGIALSVTAAVHNAQYCIFSSNPSIPGLERRLNCARGSASVEGATRANTTAVPRRYAVTVVVTGPGGRLTRTATVLQAGVHVSKSTAPASGGSTVSGGSTLTTTAAAPVLPAPSIGAPGVALGSVSTSLNPTDGVGGGPGGDAQIDFTISPHGLATSYYVSLSVAGLVVNQTPVDIAAATATATTAAVNYTGLPLATQFSYTVEVANTAAGTSASGTFATVQPVRNCGSGGSGAVTGRGAPSQICWAAGLSFPSYGNDYWSDCTLAAAAYLQQTWSNEVGDNAGGLDPTTLLNQYEALSGASPANPDVDVSTSQLLSQWAGAGIDGSQIDASAQLSGITNQQSMELAIWQLGGVYAVAGNLPSSDESLAVGTPWTVNNSSGASAGGHAFAVVGYDSTYVYIVTWGRIQAVTWGWWDAEVSQVVAALPDVFVKAGWAPTGSLQSLEAEYFSGN
jgi:hypothetical protein